MTLLFLFLLLTFPYLILTLIGKWFPRIQLTPAKRARVGLSLFFLFSSIGHFIRTAAMAEMLPPAIPYRIELIYLTGVLELLGAMGVWIPRLTKLTGFLLILMLIGLLPANIYSAFNRVEFGGHGAGPVYLLIRVPFQLFAIWWTYFATEQNWFRRKSATSGTDAPGVSE
ncbi:MAG TPA: DoxX family protein [Pyrinomonadaceae bacterium]|nr:DoxX family protein [Pyrinomonadaceae bacterium]